MSIENAARRSPPRSITVVAAGTQGADLGVEDQYVTVCAVGGSLHMIFGDSDVIAATTSHWPLAEGEKESFYIAPNCRYVSIVGTGAALHVAVG